VRVQAACECASSYRFDALEKNPGNTDEVFVCLTFSGGGTRAAALAYGVLQELARRRFPHWVTAPPAPCSTRST